MAVKYLPDKQYNGKSSIEFISDVYKARSLLVHNGEVNESKFDIGILAAVLEVFVSDLLVKKTEI